MSRLCDGKARHSSWLIWFKFLMPVSPAVYMFPKTGTIIGGTERCTITLWASCSLWTSETTRRCPGNCGNYGNCWGCSPISLLKNLAVYLHDKSPVYTHFPSLSLHLFAIYQTEISKVLLRRLPQSSRKIPWDFPLKKFPTIHIFGDHRLTYEMTMESSKFPILRSPPPIISTDQAFEKFMEPQGFGLMGLPQLKTGCVTGIYP